jgi:hypothetical protein
MVEEQKKEEVKPEPQAAAPAVPATPAAAPATPDAPAAAPATSAAAATPAAEKPKEVAKPRGKAARPSNCASCNKSVKKTRWYYRDGKFYCTKTCWQAAVKKQEAPKEGAVPEAK